MIVVALFQRGKRTLEALPQKSALKLVLVAVGLVVVFLFATTLHDQTLLTVANSSSLQQRIKSSSSNNPNVRVLQKEFGNNAATLMLLLQRSSAGDDDETVIATKSWHQAHVFIHTSSTKEECQRFGVRLAGAALVPIVLVEQPDGSWTGSFALPVPGQYRVEVEWYDDECDAAKSSPADPTMLEFTATGEPMDYLIASASSEHPRPKESHLFSNSAWLPTNGISTAAGADTDEKKLPEYMWLDPSLNNPVWDKDFVFTKSQDQYLGVASRRGTLTEEHGMYDFGQIGNYEIACFWGSETMADIHRRFLYLRGILSPGNRPFKFHYYPVTNLVNPDQEWSLLQQRTCRKCKHIFVSVDELDNALLTQSEFREQYTQFVNHLLKLMDDDTFPIWLLTNNEAPGKAKNCQQAPFLFPQSTDHPCNAVIRSLFQEEVFPSRVHLLDNADLVLPSHEEIRDDVLANIALRILVAVGKGVSDWRAVGQHAWADGLHRNNITEPNFELVAYDWSGGGGGGGAER